MENKSAGYKRTDFMVEFYHEDGSLKRFYSHHYVTSCVVSFVSFSWLCSFSISISLSCSRRLASSKSSLCLAALSISITLAGPFLGGSGVFLSGVCGVSMFLTWLRVGISCRVGTGLAKRRAVEPRGTFATTFCAFN